jgi:hypothetical protein
MKAKILAIAGVAGLGLLAHANADEIPLSSHKEPKWISGAELKRVCRWFSATLV